MHGLANGDAHLLDHASETPLPQAAAAAGHGCRTTTRRLNYTALPALTRSLTISNPNLHFAGGPHRRQSAQLPARNCRHEPCIDSRIILSHLPALICVAQVDRNDDMLRSCLRAIDAISRIPDADSVAPFKSLLQNIVRGGLLAPKFAAVQQERIEAAGASAMDTS